MFKILLILLKLPIPLLIVFLVVKFLAWKATGWPKKILNGLAVGVFWLLVPVVLLKAVTMWMMHQS